MSDRIRKVMLFVLISLLSMGFVNIAECAVTSVLVNGGTSANFSDGASSITFTVVADSAFADQCIVLDRTNAGTQGVWDHGEDYNLGLQTIGLGENTIVWYGGDYQGRPVPEGTYNVLLAPNDTSPLEWPPDQISNVQVTVSVLATTLTLGGNGLDLDTNTIEAWNPGVSTEIAYTSAFGGTDFESQSAILEVGIKSTLASITETDLTGAVGHLAPATGHGYILNTTAGKIGKIRVTNIDSINNKVSFEYQSKPFISGTLTYSGSRTGTFYICAYDNSMFSGAPSHTTTLASPGNYSLTVNANWWYVLVFLDENADGQLTHGTELMGSYNGSVNTSAGSATGIDIELADVGAPFTLRGAVGTVREGGDVYVPTDWVAAEDVVVKIMDTQGDWNPDNDVLISSTTSISTFSGIGNRQYNYELTGLNLTTGDRQYVVKLYKPGFYAYPCDTWVSYQDTDSSTQYINFTLLEVAPTVTVENLAVTPTTISPDNNGIDDTAEISFKYTITGANDAWQKGAHIKVIVDTNNDGEFAAFNHQNFFWDENGGPYVYMSTAGDNTTIDISLSTWNWFDALTAAERLNYKLSWDKFNSLQAGYDWSRDEWINSMDLDSNNSITKSFCWEGRDANWNAVANGTYKIKIAIDSPNWNEDDGITWENYGGDWTTPDTSDDPLTVIVQTSGISGTVKTTGGVGISGVRINAGGPASWGSGYSKSDGTYKISGLAPGNYHVNTETGESGYPNANYEGEVPVAEGLITENINFALESGGTITGTITIPAFDAFTDQWGTHNRCWLNINAWSPMSPQNGWAGFDVQASTYTQTKTYKLHLPGGTYNVRAEMEGFGSKIEKNIAVTSGETKTVNLVMVKAGTISGVVSLPEGDVAPVGGLFVDISAHSTDGLYSGWGGTHMEVGLSSAPYSIRSLLDATYSVKYQIWGQYKPGEYSETVAVTDGGDTTGINYTFAAGSKVKGTITISGDTSDYEAWPGDTSGVIQLWLNAWSPGSHCGTGTQVQIPKSVDNATAEYTISGLSDGETYHIDCWLFGYEMNPRPLAVTIPSGITEVTGQNIALAPYGGSISGTVLGFNPDITSGDGLGHTQVRVTCREPWWGDWQAPRHSDINADGTFSITGLGTGEYILTMNQYYVKPSTANPLGVATGLFGTVIERTPLANGQSLTGVVLELSAGGSITGVISVDSVTYTVDDLNGKKVTAVPMRMQWMGWAAPYMGEVRVSGGVAEYRIEGLSEDIYIVTPPTTLSAPSQDYWGPPAKDLAGTSQTVSLSSGENVPNINFTLTDGYSITGSIQRPVGGEEEHFFVGLFGTSGEWNELASTQVMFSNMTSNLSSRSASFKLTHIPAGDYVIRIFPWKMKYKVSTKNVTVAQSNVDAGTIVVSKGATIKGKLVDAQTGEAVTSDNAVEVMCEARPWVEGSWRSTFEGDPETMADCWETVGGRKTGTFYLRNLPAGNYIVRIQCSFKEREVTSNKNYVNVFIAGVVVPDSTEEVDIGTIKLREGVKISGQVTDTDGNGLANILMEASPSTARGESITCQIKTDAAGKYILKGIDPNISYWDVIAARRPWWGEGIRVRYGQKEKINIAPRATAVNFELQAATANLSGKVLAAAGVELKMPFPGEEMPAAFLLLQNTAEAHTDPMSGVEGITWPDGSFTIQGIVPGTYNLKVFSKGTATSLVPGIEIEEGNNSIADIQLVKGGAVYGTVKDNKNKNINTTMFELPVAMKTDFSAMVFGTFNSNAVTKEIESYRIEGLEPGVGYYVVLAADEGSEVFISETPVSVSSVTEAVKHNVIYTDLPPNFLVGVYKNAESKYMIMIWATETLSESDPADVVTLKNTTAGDGISDGTLSNLKMENNRQDIRAVYTPAAGDVTCIITITGHDLVGQESTPKDYTFGLGVDAFNLVIFNPLMGGTLQIGEGDSASLAVPGGAIEQTNNVEGTMSKVQEVGATVSINGAPLCMAAYPPKFVQAHRAPKPARGDKVSPYYDVNIGTSEIGEDKSAKITLQYTAANVSDVSSIDVYSFDGIKWVAELDGRKVDEVNHTISANVSHTSLFAVFTTEGTAPVAYSGDFKAYMYPSPFKPKTDITAYFRVKLPDSLGTGNTVKIKIYNIVGELVRELEKSIDGGTQDTIDWDGNNDGGEAVASGVYIYRLTLNDEEKQIEKIAVIK